MTDDNGGLHADDPIEVECPEGCGTVRIAETLFSLAIQVQMSESMMKELGLPVSAGPIATMPARAIGWRLSCDHGVSGDLYHLIALPARRAELVPIACWPLGRRS